MSERARLEKILENRHPLTNLANIDPVFQSLTLGESGLAGQVDIFPATAAKGRLRLLCVDQSGDTIVTVQPAAFAAARTVTIPDPGANASFVLTQGAQTIVGVKTFTGRSDLAGSDNSVLAATGITTGTGTLAKSSVVRNGTLIKTTFLIDLTGLRSTGADDVIGVDGTSLDCHWGRITAAVNGTIAWGQVTCIETPAGGDPDVDAYASTDATGSESDDITALAGTGILLNNGDWTGAVATPKAMTAIPAANEYLYLGAGAATDADYTAGQFLIELWGYDA